MPDIYNIYGTTSTNYIQKNLCTTSIGLTFNTVVLVVLHTTSKRRPLLTMEKF